MSVTITITGSDAAEAVKELSSLAKSFVSAIRPADAATQQAATAASEDKPAAAPKAEKPKAADKPKTEPVAEKPKVEEPKKPSGLTLPKDGSEREKAATAFMKAAVEDYDAKAAELALYPAEDQYTLLRQCGIELMQTGRKAAFDKASADFGIKALKDISGDSPKMLTHYKTLIDLLSV